MSNRERARELAETYTDNGNATDWFEVLYAEGAAEEADIPWADFEPNPNLVEWLDQTSLSPRDTRALKVGCGLGDDVEELADRGFDVTAFDISPTAIEWCRERFPDSEATYLVSDLFAAPRQWIRAFDFVLESYTLQVLPPKKRRRALPIIADFVGPSGTLLVICRGRDPEEPEGELPWPLPKDTLLQFEDNGLDLVHFEDYYDDESLPVRRFRAEFRRAS